ncbi:MAG: 2-oxo acid dehydrogenase subunit E2 [Actinomycetales bacterium]|nr:2-oxo acid dehydrogenase subunit E2 [Actinomycetales bacterium]
MSARRTFRLPDPGEGLMEAEIVRWLAEPGESIELDQPIVEIETAKALLELPSPYAGRVETWHVQAGQTLAVGEPLVTILTAEDDEPAVEGASAGPTPTAEPVTGSPLSDSTQAVAPVQPMLVGYGATAATTATAGGAWSAFVTRSTGERTMDDARPAEPMRRVPTDAADFGTADQVRVPLRGVLGQMAIAMTTSARDAAHASMWRSVDMTEVMNAVRGVPGLSPLVLIARGLVHAAAAHPAINAQWTGDGAIVVHRSVGLGVAVASPRGLVVPVVRQADQCDVATLSGAMRQLVQRARAGTLTVSDLAGGTITVTNVGSLGAEGASPILKPGEAAILAVGRVCRRPWVVGEGDREHVAIRDVVQLTLTVDHRMVDGALAATVLGALIDYLLDEAPGDVARLTAAP